ncbi:T9SS type A sorting domain-containing protein [Pinibacter soli]|uniref:T9SS type A sorting domain-containing protein n=1 Tax=Pinibacter soli TaxID=3044211 RepID=A0ABT6RC17_9BACT|nr:T9SS type A sorting domain-containing protein [Pinibacter soli]MDI3320112.1 T9SS type A sorting domain-containing protein [Pinibacter soli]
MKQFLKNNIKPRLGLSALLLLLGSGRMYAQTSSTYIDGVVSVPKGTTLQWYGNVEIAPTAKIYIEDGAKIIFYGDVLKMDASAQIFGANAAWTVFTAGTGTGSIVFQKPNPNDNSTGQQVLIGNNSGSATANTFPSIEINNTNGVKLNGSNTRIGSNLTFTAGHLYTDVQDAVLSSTAAITGADKNKYVVTAVAAPTGGHLVKESFTGAFVFPVGMADNDYTPATITPASANTIHVNVTDYANDAPAENNGADGMKRSWNIYGNTSAGATVALTHNSGTNGGQWISGANFVTQYGSANPNLTGDKTTGVLSQWQSNTPGASSAAGGAGTETNSRVYPALATTASANQAWYSKASDVIKPLPLKLLSFNAGKQLGSSSNTAILTWTAAEQVNTKSFIVERSTDGKNYQEIGSKAAAGNYAGEMTYTFTDANASTGTNYYRLKMVDIDGQSTYSSVKTVAFDAAASVNVYIAPNPTRGQFYVKGLTQASVVRVIDMSGKVLQTYSGITQFNMVNISQLPAAVYLVQVVEEGKFVGTFKVVKE